MTPSLLSVDERTRKNLSSIFQGLSRVGQTSLAKALNVSEATVSRMKEEGGELERAAKVLAVLGYKPVPIHWHCLSPDRIEWLLRGTRFGVTSMTAESLEEDPE